MNLKEMKNEFERLSAETTPAHYYCMHKNEDGSDAVVMDAENGECRCMICGTRFPAEEPDIEEDFNELYRNLEYLLSHKKFKSEYVDNSAYIITLMIQNLEDIKSSYTNFMKLFKNGLESNENRNVPPFTFPNLGFTPNGFGTFNPETGYIPNYSGMYGGAPYMPYYSSNPFKHPNPIMENKKSMNAEEINKYLFGNDKPVTEGCPYDTEKKD